MKTLLRMAVTTLLLAALLTVGAAAKSTKLIALTFDDGPSPEYTPQVLDILKEKQVKATFFLIGRWLPGNSALVNREVEEGHQIANHTYLHVPLAGLSDQEIRADVKTSADALTQMTGLTDFMVRPPMGSRNKRVLADIDAPVILWSVDAAAGKQVSAPELVRRTLAKAGDGGIILMHDTTPANVNAVAGIIDGLRSRGYEFVTVRELFRLRGVTPKKGVLYQRVVSANPQAYDERRLTAHWAWSAINEMTARGLMTGGRAGWQPNRYLTRAQAVSVLWRMNGAAKEGSPRFADVVPGTYYAQAVAWAGQEGVARGSLNGDFYPNSRVTREQLYTMVARLAAAQGKDGAPAGVVPVTYPDDDRIDAWALSGVQTIRAMGFVSKNDVELFRPQDWATRAETAELLDWYLGL